MAFDNIYYEPEKFDLEIFAEEDCDRWTGFDMYIVWRNVVTGLLFYAHDSGCSCPIPFDDVEMKDLIPLTYATFEDFRSWLSSGDLSMSEQFNLISKTREYLKNDGSTNDGVDSVPSDHDSSIV